MVGVGLIVEHHVVAGGYAKDVVYTGTCQQDGQILYIVLVCHHVVCVAAVAAHGYAGELAHEVVLEACPYYLTAVVKVFRTDEAYHCVHHERFELPGKGVAAGFHCNLVGTVVGIGGELASLSCLEVHYVRTLCCSLFLKESLSLTHCVGVEAECAVSFLAAGNGLEYHVAGSTPLNCFDLGGNMPQYADLGRNLEPVLYLVETFKDAGQAGYCVVDRVQAKEGVAAPIGKALEQGGGDAVHIVGGVIGLEAGGEAAPSAYGGVAGGGYPHLVGTVDQIQVAHELAHTCHHLCGKAV